MENIESFYEPSSIWLQFTLKAGLIIKYINDKYPVRSLHALSMYQIYFRVEQNFTSNALDCVLTVKAEQYNHHRYCNV